MFSPNGQLIVSSSYDRAAFLWDVETGVLLHTFEGFSYNQESWAFSPDGIHLASAGCGEYVERLCVRGVMNIWDINSGGLLYSVEAHTRNIASIAYSSDGALIASAGWDRTVRIWDAETGTLLQTLVGHTGGVSSVTFSPDGTHIVSGGGGDGTIRIWGIPDN